MSVVICPGIHPPQLTENFLSNLSQLTSSNLVHDWLVYPSEKYPAYSPQSIVAFIHQQMSSKDEVEPIVFIAYSAGVVGASLAARSWHRHYGRVKALLACDGWGVPLLGDFPIHRLSHDYFTHWSCRFLGASQDSFYAEPAVTHLDFWRAPVEAQGWWLRSPDDRCGCNGAEFILHLLQKYGEI